MTEAEFQLVIVDAVRAAGWDAYHVQRPDKGKVTSRGFPDLIIRKDDQLIVTELKTDKGRMRYGQEDWLRAFRGMGVPTYLLRPKDFPDFDTFRKYSPVGEAFAAHFDTKTRIWFDNIVGCVL